MRPLPYYTAHTYNQALTQYTYIFIYADMGPHFVIEVLRPLVNGITYVLTEISMVICPPHIDVKAGELKKPQQGAYLPRPLHLYHNIYCTTYANLRCTCNT